MKINITITTTPTLTLKEAVLAQVQNLIPDGSFSSHDVTCAVRAAANAGTIKLPGLEARANDEGITYWVNHEDVRRVVNGLKNDGTLANLGLTHVVDNGTYRMFHFGVPVVAATVPQPVGTPHQTPFHYGPVANRRNPAPLAPTPAVNTNPTQSPVETKIEAYLVKVGSATMKQIQGALKINGITCKDLATMVAGLGYDVVPGTDGCFSTYTVEA